MTGTFSATSSDSLSASSSAPVISFPSGTATSASLTTGLLSTPSSGLSSPTFTLPPNTQFSYLTATSLLRASIASSSVSLTLTNPDAAATTLSLVLPSNSYSVSAAPLPSDLPARIYPPSQVDVNNLPSGYTLCSLLFTPFLRWNFVAQSTQSQGQIFAWMPFIVTQALNITAAETPPFALQAFVPNTYQGPKDVDLLLTEFLFYLPSALVPVLANQIKVASSPFYNVGPPYNELANQVDPAFALTSVPNPSAVPGSSSGATSREDKSRTNTIIGVVGALGGLALVILGVLVFNGVKRRRELLHRRLSDPNVPSDPYPDRTGREFDQDSVGGQRRRSFYFAEDSLRGQQQMVVPSAVPMVQAETQYVVQPGSQTHHYPRTRPESMRERRVPVVPGAISAPILTQSSLNW
ncbi:hypothetical protein F5148DRAFT_445942 [Russula earlei]|uniref:Uncharacterized protein n=1 Tax=Russula earlei TaxID=71964 RepID=A0ACC0TZS5_9AGAM|nr:hypothetical protein F5148DRAFT_445942 [Russula earlei]